VQTEDEAIWLGVIVIVRDTNGLTALLAIHSDGLGTTSKRWSLSATCGASGGAAQEREKEE